jgi:hypothetical protein
MEADAGKRALFVKNNFMGARSVLPHPFRIFSSNFLFDFFF